MQHAYAIPHHLMCKKGTSGQKGLPADPNPTNTIYNSSKDPSHKCGSTEGA